MTPKNSSNLIEELVADLKPTPGLLRPGSLLSLWILGSLAYGIFVITTVFGQPLTKTFRPDFSETSEFAILFLAFVTSSVLCFASAIPGVKLNAWMVRIPWLFFFVWLGFLLLEFQDSAISSSLVPQVNELVCAGIIIGTALPLVLALCTLIHRLAPERVELTGWLLFISALSGGAACLEYFCPHQDVYHRLLSHLGVVTALSFFGFSFGKRFLKW